MEILAKSAPVANQIEDKINKGCDGIEIQLIADFLDENNSAKYFFEQTIKAKNVDVKVVHMPLIEGIDINLELFNYPIYEKAFIKAAEFTQMLAEYFGHKIIIIIHNGFTLEQYKQIPILLDFINDLFEKTIQEYPDVEYAFENILPFVLDQDRNPRGRNGFFYDNVDLAIYFNQKFNTSIFGTVFDTCHFMVTEKILKSVFTDKYSDIIKDFSLEEVFKQNKGLIKVFHLANAINLGYNKYEHGEGFSESREDMKFLDKFFRLYHKYAEDAYVTLEVYEKNYLDSQNFLRTKILMDKYYK